MPIFEDIVAASGVAPGNYQTRRHKGNFSQNNPYYQQLNSGFHRKGDQDALYELAVKWEADYSTTLENREYSEQLRDEQREYELPINEVIRNRQAGINLDIAGGSAGVSGSGSGAVSNSAPMQTNPTNNTSKFTNIYDDVNAGVSIVNAVGNFVNSFSGGVSNVISGISQLRKMPAELAISEVQADIAQATKQDIIDRSKSVNINDGIARIVQLSELFTNESSDDDISAFLGSIGYDADSIPTALSGIRQVQKNPLFKAKYENWKAEMIQAEEFNRLYPSYVVSNMLWSEQQTRNYELSTKLTEANLRNAVTEILATQDYAESIANETISATNANIATNNATAVKSAYDIKQFNAHIDAFEENIRNISDCCSWIKEEINRVNQLPRTPENIAYTHALEQSLGTLRTTGQYNCNVVNDVVNELGRKYYMRTLLTPDGQLLPEPKITQKRRFVYSNIMFNQIESGEADISSVVDPLKSVVKLFIP